MNDIQHDITIVTAFFDIGRGGWTPEKGHPHYLERSNDVYIERFSYLAQLENELVVYSTPDIIEKLKPHRAGKENKTTFIEFDLGQYSDVRESIAKIQLDPTYQCKINPAQAKNPEYWNPDYVLVTNLKAFFVNCAIQLGHTTNELVSWIDFGYCRDKSKVPSSKKWQYDFDDGKIHLFNYQDYKDTTTILDVISNNDVHILGAKVVANKSLWPELTQLMADAFHDLQSQHLVDDDQGLWLMSYLAKPELFTLHKIPDHQLGHDPFVLFSDYNTTIDNSDIIRINTNA